MTQEDRRFLEQMDLLQMQGKSASDLQNTETIRRMTAISTSRDAAEPDLWTQAAQASADGTAKMVLQTYSKIKASDLDSDTKAWLETVLLCSLEEPSEEALQSLAGPNPALQAPDTEDSLGVYARFLASQEVTARRKARKILQAKRKKQEMEKEAALRKNVGEAQNELAKAQNKLNKHLYGGGGNT